MINIWDFVNSKKVKIVDIDGKEFVGSVIDVSDAEEDDDATEDSITINVRGRYIGFTPSEIKSIGEVN